MNNIKKHILLICSVIIGFNGFSQDNLSLADAIAIGLKNNYQIQIEFLRG